MNGIILKSRETWLIAASAVLLWISQPPLAAWPVAMIALVPWLLLLMREPSGGPRYGLLWVAAAAYWLLSLQGLRHAHPAMSLCWIALSGYLAVYPVLFFAATRWWLRRGVPMIVVAPVVWVGLECVRNYLLTGISAVMLGHALADAPLLIQIADLGGTYAVSLLVVVVNVAVAQWIGLRTPGGSLRSAIVSTLVAGVLLAGVVSYGLYRLNQPTRSGSTRFLLVGRDEAVEYEQDARRELEIFERYARQTLQAATAGQPVDAIVWPESMFSGSLPWLIVDDELVVPEGLDATPAEFRALIDDNQRAFVARAAEFQRAFAARVPQANDPHLLVGCGVVRYGHVPRVYSAMVHVAPGGEVANWYGKNHLVMFGEYLPLVTWVPGLRALVPPGLGVQPGPGAVAFDVGSSRVAANICIETAVERVTVGHLAQLRRSGPLPAAIVTVTNDRWFDHSSIVDHHLRCAQLVAVGCRRPILSAANGGPTAWIDSYGRVVERLAYDAAGTILARPDTDARESLYVALGDWPARLAAIATLVTLGVALAQRRGSGRATEGSAET